ncbi:MAG TPA: M81 family metallopeptidase [Candidatus Baltobacteraceae bacterium]|nr:M81 family metallopeptidase [Candidatus Baltobacteraceae bacterium]
MKILTGALLTETNTFSPIPTGWAAFDRTRIQRGEQARFESTWEFAPLVRWRELAERDGHTVVESIAAVAEPGGRTVRAVFESLRDELLTYVERAQPLDVVLLYLHGAMAAEGYDDCDGDVLARCRKIVGPGVVIGAELDLHGNLSGDMVSAATAIVAYKEYPHTDMVDRSEDLYRICVDAAAGKIDPVMAMEDCRMVGLWPTGASPMRELVDEAIAAEGNGVLSVTLMHGFPWADVDGCGAKALAIANGDGQKAQRAARHFAQRFRDVREAAHLSAKTMDEAIDEAGNGDGPVVLADISDNAGGGAPGDSTFLLRRLLERNVRGVVAGTYYDPVAVELCADAGVGATIDLRIGGKLGPASGDPLDLRVTVRSVVEDHTQTAMDQSAPAPLGRSAWVTVDGIDIALASVRSQVFFPDAFTGLGIPLDACRIIALKSTNHFRAGFSTIAKRAIYVNAPGALQVDFANIGYKIREPDYWPRV